MSYNKFCDMEAHTGKEAGVDEKTGWKYEYWDIGMVRNAKHPKRMKVFLDPAPHIVLDQNVPLRGWYKDKHAPKGTRPRPCWTEALLAQPYGGACPVRCIMCYVNNGVRGYRGQGVTVVDPLYAEKVEQQIQKMYFANAVYITPFTEPFQILEKHYHNTQRLVEVVTKYNLPFFLLSRKKYPDWALEALKQNPHSYMQVSIVTARQSDHVKISPNAASVATVLQNVKRAHDMGIYVSVQVNPVLYGLVPRQDILDLIWKLAYNGANHLIFKFVECVSPAVPALISKFAQAFPDRIAKFRGAFTETIGGVRTIREDNRLSELSLYRKECDQAGVTMATCYEYIFDRGRDNKPVDKTGINCTMFQSSDQCHGKSIPMYVRVAKDRFEPFQNCDKGGCLYCKDRHGIVPCGSMLGQAKALQPKDYQQNLFNSPYVI
jgi:DNA repair photolyase